MNVWFPSKYEIKNEVRLSSLKSYSDRINTTIKELQELQQLITNRATEIINLDFSYEITIVRRDYHSPVWYDVSVYQVYEDDNKTRVYIESKKFNAGREDKKALREYVFTLEDMYRTICKADFKKLKL